MENVEKKGLILSDKEKNAIKGFVKVALDYGYILILKDYLVIFYDPITDKEIFGVNINIDDYKDMFYIGYENVK